MTSDGGKYLTLQQTVKTYQISERTLRRLLAEGRLTRYRQPGQREVLLSRKELDRVIRPQPEKRE